MAIKTDFVIPESFPAVLEDQILFWMDNIHDSQIYLTIRLKECIDEGILEKAVRLTLDAEPVLGCRFVNGFWRSRWKRLDNLDVVKLVHLVQTTNPADELLRLFERDWIDARTGPQVKVWIIRSCEDILCIKASHVVMDAGGLKDYGYLLASVYQKLKNNPDFKPESSLKGNRGLSQISKHFKVLDKLKIIRRSVRDLASYTFPFVHANSNRMNQKPFNRKLAIRTFDKQMLQTVKEFGTNYLATVNDVMAATFIQAFYEIINPDPEALRRLVTTCDLRRYIPGKKAEALCNLSGFAYLNIGKNKKASFKEILKLVQDQMNQLKKDYIGLGGLPLSMLVFKFIPFPWALWVHDKISDFIKKQTMTTGNVSPLFTNTGVIDLNRLAFVHVEAGNAYITTTYSYPPVLAVCLSGCGNSLTLSAGFCENTIKSQMVECLFDHIEQNIQSFSA